MTHFNCHCPNGEYEAKPVKANNARDAAYAYASEVRDELGIDEANSGEDWGWSLVVVVATDKGDEIYDYEVDVTVTTRKTCERRR